METLLKSDAAMDVLATISLAQFVVIIALIVAIAVCVYKFRDGIKEFLEDYRMKANHKEEIMSKINKIENFDNEIHELKEYHDKDIEKLKDYHDQDMDLFYQKQLGYRQQSLEKQAHIEEHFAAIDKKIDELIQIINAQHEENREIKKNELREKLMDLYRFHASIERNPEQEWTEVEAEVFWNLFNDYEKLNGNGFMHNTVKPAMKKLKVVTL